MTDGEQLAMAVEQLWDAWSPGSSDPGITRDTIRVADHRVTVLQVADGSTRTALIALPSFVEREWLARAATAAGRQRVRVTLRDPAVRGASATEARRLTIDSGLPWTVVASDADPQGELARLDARRSLWLAGFAAVTLLIVTGAHAVTRAVGRELAVARLKSDFVAAVSHEFRTPLTSLRQLTEILIDERITSDDRRRTYYRALERQTDRLHRLVRVCSTSAAWKRARRRTGSHRSTLPRWSEALSRNSPMIRRHADPKSCLATYRRRYPSPAIATRCAIFSGISSTTR